MTTLMNGKVKPNRNHVGGLRDGGGDTRDPIPVGSPEVADAIQRAVRRRDDPTNGVRRRQRTPLVGRAAGEPTPMPNPPRVPRLRCDPAVTARALELRAEGRTWPEIGRALGEKPTTIRLRCARAERQAA